MTKSWDAYKNLGLKIDKEFGSGAFNAVQSHLRSKAGNAGLDKYAGTTFNQAVRDVDDEAGTLNYHESWLQTPDAMAFLNNYAGRPVDSTAGFMFSGTSQFVDNTSPERRGSIFNPTATSLDKKQIQKRRASVLQNGVQQ